MSVLRYTISFVARTKETEKFKKLKFHCFKFESFKTKDCQIEVETEPSLISGLSF